MPRFPPDPRIVGLLKYLGLWAGGDLGAYTIYQTKHGKRVMYPRAPPTEPPTPAQQTQRSRFSIALRRWRALTQADRNAWEALSKQAHLIATGLNLYLHLSLTPDRDAWLTLVARTQTTLTAPDYVPF
jgi:hypothetical protein